jgi:hypothetical protein
MLFTGKHGVKTRVYTAYRPCKAPGYETVFKQQQRFFRRNGDPVCPRAAFLRDIGTELQTRRSAGDRLLVMLDANEDVRSGPLATLFTEIGLREGITSHHHDLPSPKTYNRGRLPIDGIFLTGDLIVNNAGWLPFDKSLGDHRLGYIDMDWSNFVGSDALHIVRPPARRLSTQIPRALQSYNGHLEKFFTQHKILLRLHHIVAGLGHILSPEKREQLASLDLLRASGMRYAEKRCRKLCMGAVEFSPEVNRAYDLLQLWRMVTDRKEGKKRSSRKIRRLAKKGNVQKPLSCSLEQARMRLTQAKAHYRSYKKTASIHRARFLHDRKDDPDLTDLERRSAERLIRVEDARNLARQMKRLKGTPASSSISAVKVSTPTGVQIHRTQDLVEKTIMEGIEARYRLTEGTPFTVGILSQDIDLLGSSSASERVLSGTYVCSDSIDEVTRDLIQILRKPDALTRPVSLAISSSDYINHWKGAKESTSSSLSGLHFGHWKAAASNTLLAEVHALFCEITCSTGFSLPRWRKSLIVMLEKVPGNIWVDKLRAILLLEADFNFTNNLIYQFRMVSQAASDGLLQPECMGGIKHSSSETLAICRRLITDHARQQKLSLAIASVDAAQCYDCVGHGPGSLCCQRWGVPPEGLATMLGTIQQMQFFLRTSFGDSDTSFGGDNPNNPLQGVCQGNGGGPAVWLAISAVLTLLLHRRGDATRIASPMTQRMATLVGLLFVDDTDVFSTSSTDDPQASITRLQHAVNSWRDGLTATGGALRPEKCSWGLISYHWINGRAVLSSPDAFPAAITVQNRAGLPEPISRNGVKDALTVVGVVQRLDGIMKEQVAATKNKADNWSIQIKTGSLYRRLAWYSLNTSIWPGLGYGLPACTLSLKEGDSIVSQLYTALLPELGTHRHFPLQWRYAPLSLGGLALPRPYEQQGIGQTKFLLTMGESSSLPGRLLTATLENAQLELGSMQPFLQLDYSRWGHLLTTHTFVGCVWKYLSERKAKVVFESTDHLQGQRTNDTSLMDVYVRQCSPSRDHFDSFNACRLAAQVFFLSDLTEGNGRDLRPSYLTANTLEPHAEPSSYDWPTSRPANKDWSLWRTTLLLLFPHSVLPQRLRLGSWTRLPHKQIPWYWHPVSLSLWHHEDTTWNKYTLVDGGPPRRPIYRCVPTSGVRPTGQLLPATASRKPYTDTDVFYGGSDLLLPPPPLDSISSILQDMGERAWPLRQRTFPHDGLAIALAITHGSAIAVADGSFKPGRALHLGAAAWIIHDPSHPAQSCSGATAVSGGIGIVSAYRAELQGVHAILLALWTICLRHSILAGHIKIACDNLEAVTQSQYTHLDPSTKLRNVDLIRAIRRLVSRLPITIAFEHVFGHQDDIVDRQLTLLEVLNIEMDRAAKLHLDQLIYADQRGELPPCSTLLYGEGVGIYVGDRKIFDDPTYLLQLQAYSPDIRRSLHDKGKLDESSFPLVDFAAMDAALRLAPQGFRLWTAKHLSGHCAVGRMMKLWRFWDTDNCPCCHAPRERSRHVNRCPSPVMRSAFAARLVRFKAQLLCLRTSPDITTCLLSGTMSPTCSFLPSPSLPVQVRRAASEQNRIGWDSTLEGRISSKWRHIQYVYQCETSDRKTPASWAAGVVKALLELTHGMWTARNDVLHVRDRQGLQRAEALALQQRLATLRLTPREDLLVRDRRLLRPSYLALLDTLRISAKEAWISEMEVAILCATEARSTEDGLQSEALAAWLAPPPSTNDHNTPGRSSFP